MPEIVYDIIIEFIAFVLGVATAVWLAEYVDYRQQNGGGEQPEPKKENLFAWSMGVWAKIFRAMLGKGKLW